MMNPGAVMVGRARAGITPRTVHSALMLLLLVVMVFSPALAGLMLMVGVATFVRPASEGGRALLAAGLAGLGFLVAAVAHRTVSGSCDSVFAVTGLLAMGLSTWTSLRR